MKKYKFNLFFGSFLLATSALLTACGGGGSDNVASNPTTPNQPTQPSTPTQPSNPTVDNQVAVIVDQGPLLPNGKYNSTPNIPFVTVTVCQPGTNNCATIDHVVVDTGSTGLRVFEQSVGTAILDKIAYNTAPSGDTLAQCMQFADGYVWGTVKSMDMKIGGKSASNIPVQIIGDSKYPSIPSACSNTGGSNNTAMTDFGAKGIIGIGYFKHDCGLYCEMIDTNTVYFACNPNSPATCVNTKLAQANQVVNPITTFATDNNGSILSLQSVGASGVSVANGTLTFGVGTRSNNSLDGQFLALDQYGYLKTNYKGKDYNLIIDSGSSVTFLSDLSIPYCDSSFTNFYCPTSDIVINTNVVGGNGASSPVTFTISNAANLVRSNPTYNAYPGLAADSAKLGYNLQNVIDFGLPFFYGRPVATTIEGTTNHKGSGAGIIF